MSEVNIKDEKFELKLTEWELDVIQQAVGMANIPMKRAKLASILIDKLTVQIDKANKKES